MHRHIVLYTNSGGFNITHHIIAACKKEGFVIMKYQIARRWMASFIWAYAYETTT